MYSLTLIIIRNRMGHTREDAIDSWGPFAILVAKREGLFAAMVLFFSLLSLEGDRL